MNKEFVAEITKAAGAYAYVKTKKAEAAAKRKEYDDYVNERKRRTERR